MVLPGRSGGKRNLDRRVQGDGVKGVPHIRFCLLVQAGNVLSQVNHACVCSLIASGSCGWGAAGSGGEEEEEVQEVRSG